VRVTENSQRRRRGKERRREIDAIYAPILKLNALPAQTARETGAEAGAGKERWKQGHGQGRGQGQRQGKEQGQRRR